MLERLTNRVFYTKYNHYSDRPNLGYVKGDKFSLMFDAGASPEHVQEYFEALDEKNLPHPDFAVISHWHYDHAFGMCALGMPTIATRQTNDQLALSKDWTWDEAFLQSKIEGHGAISFCLDMLGKEYGDRSRIRVSTADIVFTERMTIDLGGAICELLHVGGPHSEDSLVCCVEGEGILFLGDSHGKDMLGLEWDYDPKHPERLFDTIKALPYDPVKLNKYVDVLRKLDFAICLGGHEDPMTREELFNRLKCK